MDTLTESGLCWIAECRDEAYASDSFKAFVEKDVDEQVSSEFLRWREFVKKTFSIRSIEEYRNQPVYICGDKPFYEKTGRSQEGA